MHFVGNPSVPACGRQGFLKRAATEDRPYNRTTTTCKLVDSLPTEVGVGKNKSAQKFSRGKTEETAHRVHTKVFA